MRESEREQHVCDTGTKVKALIALFVPVCLNLKVN